jgi:hypothetical protein
MARSEGSRQGRTDSGLKLRPRGAELRRIEPQLRLHRMAINVERKRIGSVVTLSIENGKSDSPQHDSAGG